MGGWAGPCRLVRADVRWPDFFVFFEENAHPHPDAQPETQLPQPQGCPDQEIALWHA